VPDSASAPNGRLALGRPSTWSSALGAPALAFVALASYAIFRASANAKLVAPGTADIVDAICFGIADFSMVVLSFLAARSAHDEPATRRAWSLILLASFFSATGSSASTLTQILHPGTLMPLWTNVVFC